jgi:Cu-Zn family superoxide dismutase
MPHMAGRAISRVSAFVLAAGATSACGGNPKPARVVPPAARTQLIDIQGHPVGTASVLESSAGGLLVLKLRSIPPGVHGLHLHANGACDPPNFGTAGPHYNPGNRKHGSRNPQGPHAGDLPNVTARADSTVDTTLAVPGDLVRAIGSGANARALVLHASPDDLMTDPSGSSGDRIACGVLER